MLYMDIWLKLHCSAESYSDGELGLIETGPVIKLDQIIADTLWSSTVYHGNNYPLKIWPNVIIFLNRRKISNW
jgi:hypothetical protein